MGELVHVKVKIFVAPSCALKCKGLTLELNAGPTAENLLKLMPATDKNYNYVVREGMRLQSASKLNGGDEVLVVPSVVGAS